MYGTETCTIHVREYNNTGYDVCINSLAGGLFAMT